MRIIVNSEVKRHYCVTRKEGRRKLWNITIESTSTHNSCTFRRVCKFGLTQSGKSHIFRLWVMVISFSLHHDYLTEKRKALKQSVGLWWLVRLKQSGWKSSTLKWGDCCFWTKKQTGEHNVVHFLLYLIAKITWISTQTIFFFFQRHMSFG